MGRINWSSYPGDPPTPPDPHPNSEALCELLENAGVEQSVIDKACDLLDELVSQANRECEFCERREQEQMRKDAEEFERLDRTGEIGGESTAHPADSDCGTLDALEAAQ